MLGTVTVLAWLGTVVVVSDMWGEVGVVTAWLLVVQSSWMWLFGGAVSFFATLGTGLGWLGWLHLGSVTMWLWLLQTGGGGLVWYFCSVAVPENTLGVGKYSRLAGCATLCSAAGSSSWCISAGAGLPHLAASEFWSVVKLGSATLGCGMCWVCWAGCGTPGCACGTLVGSS